MEPDASFSGGSSGNSSHYSEQNPLARGTVTNPSVITTARLGDFFSRPVGEVVNTEVDLPEGYESPPARSPRRALKGVVQRCAAAAL